MYNRPPTSSVFPVDTRAQYARMLPDARETGMAAIMSKLVPEVPSQRVGVGGLSTDAKAGKNKSIEHLDLSLLTKISDMTANDVNDARSIFQLLPETQLAMQILTSSILSPKDMVTTSINFGLEQNRFSSDLASAMQGVIEEHFEKVYKISDLLTPSLEDALFMTGSYPLLILPENSIDVAINSVGRVTMESINDQVKDDNLRHLGYLGNPVAPKNGAAMNLGLEALSGNGSYGTHTYVPKMVIGMNAVVDDEENGIKAGDKMEVDTLMEVVDNPSILKMPALRERMAQDRIDAIMQKQGMLQVNGVQFAVSQESFGAYTEYNLGTRRKLSQAHVPLEIIKTNHEIARDTIGHPTVMKLPSESVIPVHQPGAPRKHLGYFILLDELGNPINSVDQRDYFTDMANSLNTNSSMGSQILAQAKRALMGQETSRQTEIEEMARVYGRMIDRELTQRLEAGPYGRQLEVTVPEEIYRVMFARRMAHQRTKVLYVPAQMMVYIAFDYNKYGIGQSLLQQSKVLGGIRVVSLLADAMAGIKNSINRTQLAIQLEPTDPNPSQTVEFLLHEFAKTRQGIFPLGATNPVDINSYLQRASIDVVVTGNTRYPEIKMDVTERQSNRVKPDTDFTDKLRDAHLQAMGLSPDMVDAGQGADFATSVLANNLLLAKRVLTYQTEFEGFLNDFVIKYVLADGALMAELRKLVDENRNKLTREQQRANEISKDAKDQRDALTKGKTSASMESMSERLEDLQAMGRDAVIMEFLQALRLRLPKPDMATAEAQASAYNSREEFVDKCLGNWINEAYLTEQGLGDLKDLVPMVKEAAKAKIMRDWMADNNVMPEIFTLLTNPDPDEQPDLIRGIEDHVKSMSKSLLHVMYALATTQRRTGPAVERLKKIVGPNDDFGGGGSYDYQSAPANPSDDLLDPGMDVGGGDALDVPPGDETGGEPPADETGTGEEGGGGDMSLPPL